MIEASGNNDAESKSSSRKRRTGAIASYIYSIAQIVVNLVYVPILLQGIGQAEYGLYQMIGSIIAYMTIVNSTISAGVTRFYCKYYAINDEAGMANTLGTAVRLYNWASLIAVAAGITLIAIVRLVYADALTPWQLDESSIMIVILVVNLIVTMHNTISISTINAHEEFVFLRITMLFTVVMQPIVVAFAVQVQPYAVTVCLVQFVLNSVCCIIQRVFAKRKLHMDTKLRFTDKELRRGLLHFSGGILLALIADQIFWRSNQLILGYLYGPEEVAVYSVGYQVIIAYMTLGAAIGSVFMPRVSEIYQDGKGSIRELSALFTKVGRIALYPLLLVLTGFVVFGQEFVGLWAGDGFTDAYWIAVIVMVPFTVDIAQNIGLIMLQVMDKYYFRARMYFVASLANIALAIVLAIWFGGIGAACATGVSMLVSSGIILNVYYARIIGFDMVDFWKNATRVSMPILALMLVGYVLWQLVCSLANISWISLIACIVIYTAAFGFIAWRISGNEYERHLIRSMTAKLKR